ncbi:DUF4235 domain-containing protein [Rhodococcus fascians]|nr:DUF4235 domain-containing protein [Rhodococcus fascians]
MSAVSKAFYTPMSLATSVLGGLAVGAVFKQIWKRVGDNDAAAPDPKDLSRSLHEVLVAAAVHGAVFGLVKAAVDRAGATGYRAVTNESPT